MVRGTHGAADRKVQAIKEARKGRTEKSITLNTLRRRTSGPPNSKAPVLPQDQTLRFQQTLAANADQSRLQITLQPARKFYTCTAKTNRLRVECCLPNPEAAPASLPVELILLYAKTQRRVEDQSILVKYTKVLCLENGRGFFEFRIEEVSSRHGRRHFAVQIQPQDTRFKPAYTTPIDVKSKVPPKRRRPNRDFVPNPFPVLSCNHTSHCESCSTFLENAVIEMQEKMNEQFAAILFNIRNAVAHSSSGSPSPDFIPCHPPPMGLPGVSPPMMSEGRYPPAPAMMDRNAHALGPSAALGHLPARLPARCGHPPVTGAQLALPGIPSLSAVPLPLHLPPPLKHMRSFKDEQGSSSDGSSPTSAEEETASWLTTPRR